MELEAATSLSSCPGVPAWDLFCEFESVTFSEYGSKEEELELPGELKDTAMANYVAAGQRASLGSKIYYVFSCPLKGLVFNWAIPVRFPQGSESVTTNRHIQTGLKKKEKKRKEKHVEKMK